MFIRSFLVLTALLGCTIGIRAQDSTARIWQGVYTAAQAERGKTTFNTACIRCHGSVGHMELAATNVGAR